MALTDVDKQKFLDSVVIGDSPGSFINGSIPSDSTELNVGERSSIGSSDSYGLSNLQLRPGLTADEILRESGTPHPDVSPGFDSGNTSSGFTDANVQPHVITMDEWLAQGGISPFTFDTNLSNEENLSNVFNWLNSVYSYYQYSGDQSSINFGNLLSYVYTTLSNSPNNYIRNLSDAASLEIAEKIVDITSSFINAQFNAAMSYQSWYLQQEYNSPINQVNRLSDAGLHTAFALGNLSSGNASSPAQGGFMQNPSASNAGQAEAQSHSIDSSLFGQIFGSAASFIPAVGGAIGGIIKDLTSSMVARKMLPQEIAKMSSEVALNQANAMRQESEIAAINSSTAINFLDSEFKYSQQELQNAQNEVTANENSFRELWDRGTFEYEELAWETLAVDNNGHTKRYTLSNEEFRKAVSNGGKIDSNYSIVGSDKWSDTVTGKATVELGKKNSSSSSGSSSSSDNTTVGNGDMSTDMGASNVLSSNLYDYLGIQGSSSVENAFTKEKGTVESKGNSTSQVFDDSRITTKGSIGYNEDGSQFHIGDSVFYSVKSRKRIPLPEYEDRIKKSLDYWQNSLDRYNALTDSQKKRLLYLEDINIKNFKTFSQGLVTTKYSHLLDSLFKKKDIPQEFLQGD